MSVTAELPFVPQSKGETKKLKNLANAKGNYLAE